MKSMKAFALICALLPISQTFAAPYAGLELGRSGSVQFKNAQDFTNTQRNGWAGRGYLGYTIGKKVVNYGVELGYNQLEKGRALAQTSQANLESSIKRRSVDLLGVVSYPVIDKLEIVAKGGVAYVDQKTVNRASLAHAATAPNPFVNPSVETVQASHKDRRVLPKTGVGFSYSITEKQGFDVTYNYTFGKRRINFDSSSQAEGHKVLSNDSINLGWHYSFA